MGEQPGKLLCYNASSAIGGFIVQLASDVRAHFLYQLH
jgi:NADPH:quinone reductase-like Zn-dependent oxidoreductase